MKTGPGSNGTRIRHRRVQFEALEPRSMLAGNVTVGFGRQGTLLFTGGADSELIPLSLQQVNDEEHLFATGNSTKINGKASVDINSLVESSSTDFNGKIVANLGDGNDSLKFSDSSTDPGTLEVDVTVQGGKGNDTVAVSNLGIKGTVRLSGGPGDDTLNVTNITVIGKAFITTEDGIDTITMKDCIATSDVSIQSGGGNDTVTFSKSSTDDSVIAGKLTIDL